MSEEIRIKNEATERRSKENRDLLFTEMYNENHCNGVPWEYVYRVSPYAGMDVTGLKIHFCMGSVSESMVVKTPHGGHQSGDSMEKKEATHAKFLADREAIALDMIGYMVIANQAKSLLGRS